ncbi:MAG: hypothetical protein H0V82_09065 [Candidatus Protochlamydia sp.]|nr:hypothetical protein [Candidatus Protochlamydia sp.]
MIKNYQDYYWKAGKPCGRGTENKTHFYRILTDPYGKRYSVEKYSNGSFDVVVYDSLLLDFRHLTPMHQTAWQRERLKEEGNQIHCLLRNQDDRAILLEKHYFELNLCVKCEIFSIHRLLVATQHLYYQSKGDSFNGVILFDLENRPVMKKTYAWDGETSEFSALITEEWDHGTAHIIA